MRKLFLGLALAALCAAPSRTLWGQSNPMMCRVVTLNCDCTNPPRKFVVEDQRVGKVNPGDPGVCESSVYIDEWLKRNRYTACVRGGQEGFDPQKPPACQATWTCKEPCAAASGK